MTEHAIKMQQCAATMQGSMHKFNRNKILVWFAELCSSSTVVSNQKCLRNYDGLKSLNSNNNVVVLRATLQHSVHNCMHNVSKIKLYF